MFLFRKLLSFKMVPRLNCDLITFVTQANFLSPVLYDPNSYIILSSTIIYKPIVDFFEYEIYMIARPKELYYSIVQHI